MEGQQLARFLELISLQDAAKLLERIQQTEVGATIAPRLMPRFAHADVCRMPRPFNRWRDGGARESSVEWRRISYQGPAGTAWVQWTETPWSRRIRSHDKSWHWQSDYAPKFHANDPVGGDPAPADPTVLEHRSYLIGQENECEL